MTLRIGSLCSGYGGLDSAVQMVVDTELAWVADPDPGAAAILAHHHPTVPNHGDITTTDWAQVEPVDILTAGFPCQDISNAGQRAGIEGERSGIWANVAAAVGVLRPRYAVFENVAAVVVRGLDTVLADLAAVGFDAEWACLRASDVGAAHRRERWFCLAWPADSPGPGLETRRQGRPGGDVAADTNDVGGPRTGPSGRTALRHPARPGAAPADSPGVREREPADEAHALTGSGNTRPQSRRRSVLATADAACVGWNTRGPEPARQFGGLDVAECGGTNWGVYADAIARWERVTGRPAPDPTEIAPRTGRPRLAPHFVEWLMGLPAGWVTDLYLPDADPRPNKLSRSMALRALGNGVVPQQGAAAVRMLLERAR